VRKSERRNKKDLKCVIITQLSITRRKLTSEEKSTCGKERGRHTKLTLVCLHIDDAAKPSALPTKSSAKSSVCYDNQTGFVFPWQSYRYLENYCSVGVWFVLLHAFVEIVWKAVLELKSYPYKVEVDGAQTIPVTLLYLPFASSPLIGLDDEEKNRLRWCL